MLQNVAKPLQVITGYIYSKRNSIHPSVKANIKIATLISIVKGWGQKTYKCESQTKSKYFIYDPHEFEITEPPEAHHKYQHTRHKSGMK